MKLIARFFRWIISFRYRVEIEGLELLDKKWPYLVMPSHIALIDPVIVWAFLRQRVALHPVTTRVFYDNVFLKPLFKLLKAIPVEVFDHDEGTSNDAKQMMQQVSATLSQYENILLYPQGGLAKQGYQSIIGKKSAFYAVQHAPQETKCIMVTIRWLWGSRSSTAWNGKQPSFTRFLCKGLYFFLLNLFVFTPKRRVSIQLFETTATLREAEKKGLDYFNVQLEKVYNAQGEEPIQYVSGLRWYNTVLHHHTPSKIEGSLDALRKKVDYSTVKYPKDTFRFIEEIIRSIKPEFSWELTLTTNLVLDLYFDSLDMAELKSAVATRFSGASNPPLLDLKLVGDVILMAMGKSPYVEELKPCERLYEENKRLIYDFLKEEITKDTNILMLLQKNFKRLKHQSVCYDQLFGVQSTKDFLIKAYLIANILKTFPWKNIAIMLPSLSATSLLIIACYLAEKIPVMLNWTQSEEAFAHCITSQEVSVILTAGSFFHKIQTPRLQNYEMTFFEELLKKVSLGQKIRALLQSVLFKLPKKLDEKAVILFTSGSESLPKAVVLTHQNIIQDLKGTTGLLDIRNDDVLLAFLPPFHSFGFTVNTILPLISGMRVVYTPDPNDASLLANLVQHTKVTVLAATPTFLKGICSIAKKDDLSQLRLAVVGAEKAPEELFHLFAIKAPQASLLEWYGITECSPIIAVGNKKWTVWLPILWAMIKILDIETGKECKPKQEGMIYVAGPFVFKGYLDTSIESPFVTIDGKKFYKTGDLGYLDKEGYLSISGRLKRFVKIAWEMISLPAMEEVLLRKYGKETEVVLAVEAKEYGDGSVKFVVFSIEPLEVSQLNAYLREQGVSNLVKISEVVLLDEIPLLGTGKTDFMSLRKMII